MSPLVITLLIVGGIFILIAIAYINHMVEQSKLEKARLKADLSDRLRRCADLSESMPGQLMTAQLKLLLSRLQLHFSERLLTLDKSAASKARVDELRQLIAQGEAIAVHNPPQPVLNEAKAKEVRFQLENLHGQITRCAKEGVLNSNEGKHWLNEVRHMLAQLHIEFFNNLGQQALQQNHPGQARLAFERGVQYLRKQTDPSRYQAQLNKLENQLARANTMVLETVKPSSDETSELTQGLEELEGEDWKKKNIYD
jgi:polyhydroxyalkanoate synthesis regulator phasin